MEHKNTNHQILNIVKGCNTIKAGSCCYELCCCSMVETESSMKIYHHIFASLISLIPCFYSTNKFSRMETSKNTSCYKDFVSAISKNDKMNLKIFRTIEIKNLFLEVTKLVESTKYFWFVFFKPLAFFEPVLWWLINSTKRRVKCSSNFSLK